VDTFNFLSVLNHQEILTPITIQYSVPSFTLFVLHAISVVTEALGDGFKTLGAKKIEAFYTVPEAIRAGVKGLRAILHSGSDSGFGSGSRVLMSKIGK
jgi:hypothetical protein